MAESSPQAQPEAPARRRPRRRLWIGLAIAAVIIVGVGLLTASVARQALAAKQDLEQAQDQLGVLRAAIGDPDQDLTALYGPLRASTADAVAQTDGVAWALYEHLPWIGPNLKAVRQTAELVDGLVENGVGPLTTAVNGLGVDSLAPHDGRVDIAPLPKLGPAVVEVDDAVQAANTAARAIDTTDVLPQVAAAVDRVRTELAAIAPVTAQARTVVPLLYPLLGGEGTRHYLLMFQNNAEERASGGNPASMAMLVVKDGKVTLGRQASSTDFPHPYAKPPYTPTGPGNGDWGKIYTDYASTYVTNITMTPDFPSTARMASAMWRQEFGGTVDGVISFDPVALSYLLNATGPIKLSDGTSIDASNAVSFLLNEVYAKYPDPATQDEIFASAARSIFAAMMSGKGDPQAYLAQLKPMVAEQRLKVWSAHDDEQRQLLTSPVGTMMPADNRVATVLGVYNNDDSTSKMSYFTDQKIAVQATCASTPTYTVSATVTNTLKQDQVADLPEYVRPHQQRIPAGGDRQWVQVFGPVGATLESVTIDGKPVVWGTNLLNRDNTNPKATGVDVRRPAVRGTMYDRPVGVVSITVSPEQSVTVQATFRGTADDSRTVEVSHTPKVRETPVEITSAGCR